MSPRGIFNKTHPSLPTPPLPLLLLSRATITCCWNWGRVDTAVAALPISAHADPNALAGAATSTWRQGSNAQQRKKWHAQRPQASPGSSFTRMYRFLSPVL